MPSTAVGGGIVGRWRVVVLVAGLVAVVGGIPLAVALGVLHQPRWYPALDLAQTELRVRDVGTSDPPMLGLSGRFFAFGERGSHLGPISFWLLWPFYTLLGSTAWALQAATAALNLLAMATATWIAHRRGGARLALIVAVVLAVLAHAYTAERLTSPWNPFLPVLWWVVFLLAVWSVLCDDLAMVPVAAFAGSFCAQTHIPYAGPVFGLGALTAVVVGWRYLTPARQARASAPAGAHPVRHDPVSGGDAVGSRRRRRRRLLRWGGLALAVTALLWLPPVIEQLTHDLGNLGLLREHFSHPREDAVGFGHAFDVWLAHLDVRGLWRIEGARTITEAPAGSPVPGLILLAAWATAAIASWRRRQQHPDPWQLHLTVGLTALLGLVAMSRVLGRLWDYLVLWAWGTTTLMVLATLLTVPLMPQRLHLQRLLAGRPAGPAPTLRPAGGTRRQTRLLLTALVLLTATFTYDAAHAKTLNIPESETLARIVPTVTGALRDGRLADGTTVPGNGADGRYLVRWHDNELATPGVGFGLLLELERQGLDVGGAASDRSAIVPHRVRELDQVTATVNVVVGDGPVTRWRSTPGAVEVAHADLRTPAEQARFERLRAEVVAGLREAGLDDLVVAMHVNVLAAAFDDRMPPDLEDKADQMLQMGGPTAVFVAPPQAG